MASTYSPNLRLELIGTGEQQGTWGSTTNTNLGTLLEEAIGGYASVTVSNIGDTTLTTNNGSADQSRNMVINLTGTISANRNVICPAIEKLYVVKNATTGGFSVTFKVTGQTGVTIPNGQTYFLYVNGIDANLIVGNVASTNATNTFTENQIIEVTDNTDAALRITQLGTGDALLVEDSSNPDSSPTVIKSDGKVLIGGTSEQTLYATTAASLQVLGGTTAQIVAARFSSDAIAPRLNFGKSRNATVGSQTVVNDGDVLFEVSGSGSDGANFILGSTIASLVDGTPGTNDMPGRLVFSTTADGASSPTERMRINNRGNINIGTAANPESVLQITGATTPTGLMIGSISGTTLTISGVTSGSVAVGDRVFVNSTTPDYNTYITAFGTGTGGVGTYTINNSATVAGGTTINFFPSRFNSIGFIETDTTSVAGQPFGGIEWYSSDSSTPGAGVKAYVAAVSEGTSAQSSLRFGTATTTSGTQAVERMRIGSNGNVTFGNADTTYPLHLFRATGEVKFNIENGTTGQDTYVNFTNPSYSGAEFLVGLAGAATGSYVWDRSSGRNIIFGTNDQQRMQISSAGNVSIGTADTTSGSQLIINNSASASTTSLALYSNGNYNGQMGLGVLTGSGDTVGLNARGASGSIALGTNNQERMRILSNGNVGVGTTNAQARLEVVGPTLNTSSSSTYAVNIANSGGGATADLSLGSNASYAYIQSFGGKPLYINSLGNPLLIGPAGGVVNKTVQTYLFDVNGQSAATQFVLSGSGNRYITSAAAGSGIVLQTNGSTDAVVLTSAGRVGVGTGAPACALEVVGGISTSRTAVTSPAATDGNVFSGTYTPTLTNAANIAASTAFTCQYMRVGNVVTVSGRVSIDPTTASTATTLGMSLPIASDLTEQTQLGGTFSTSAISTNTTGPISGNISNNRADFDIIVGTDVANRSYYFSFTYLVR